jgi:hypothetical protein
VVKQQELATLGKIQDYVSTKAAFHHLADPSRMTQFKAPFLYFLVRLAAPRNIVETGVASGVSTTFILWALERNGGGRLTSVDLPNADPVASLPAEHESGWLVPPWLRGFWSLRLGDARVVLPDVLRTSGRIDIFLHDSLHTYDHMAWEYRTAWAGLRRGGFLLSDDVTFNDSFPDFCREIHAAGVARYGIGIAVKEEESGGA